MGIRTKFNLALFFVFLLGFAVTGAVSYQLLQRNARAEVVRHAELMMEAALAIRGYTVNQVRPHLEERLAVAFLPQSVPAYAATETLNEIRKKHPDYSYKEATLNPTNLRDRATDWEADLVSVFRNANAATKEIIGERETPTGHSLYIARPIRVSDPACLACHSVPAAAPETMLKLYGSANGFGWKLNEVVGAQVVSVPMSLPVENAQRAFTTFMASLLAVFVFAFVVLNLMLSWMIIQPIRRMSQAADKVSTGDFAIEEFAEAGKDEISILGASFNRMRRSLQKAMQMIDA
ncbi:MAG: signal protein [Betaproteobacteria bacterium SG8_39]|nr:MAG: signal protein [Betaproteobacteria bacterium SG8_39]